MLISTVFDPFRFSLCIRRESAVSAMLYITVMAAPSPSLDNNLYFPTFFWAFRVLRLILRVFVVIRIFAICNNRIRCTVQSIMFPCIRRLVLTLFSFLFCRIIIIKRALNLLAPPPTRHRPKWVGSDSFYFVVASVQVPNMHILSPPLLVSCLYVFTVHF